jgi:glycosyltransferase involved in cell wall biosynthesis
MTPPLITIAMPFYNSAATLELAIRSLLRQSYGDFELLLCDDGSTDHSLSLAESFHDPRVIITSDGHRRRLAARLNQCIDRARGHYFARMDADDIAHPDRLRRQLLFLHTHPKVDLCAGGAMVFGKQGRPLWRFHPPADHAQIVRAPFRGFPLWHPFWLGRIEWFRQWRYDETAALAQDQELLLRSYRHSHFANLPQILGGYRLEHISLRKLFRYKRLHMRHVLQQPDCAPNTLLKLKLLTVATARFAANCAATLAGPEHRLGHQSAQAPKTAELAEWEQFWTLLSTSPNQERNQP